MCGLCDRYNLIIAQYRCASTRAVDDLTTNPSLKDIAIFIANPPECLDAVADGSSQNVVDFRLARINKALCALSAPDLLNLVREIGPGTPEDNAA